VPGAYSEQASLLAYDGCTPAPFDQFENAFEVRAPHAARTPPAALTRTLRPPRRQAVEQFLVDRAVLPIENSLGVRARGACAQLLMPAAADTALARQGSIHRNYDLLLRHRLHIVGEARAPALCAHRLLRARQSPHSPPDTRGTRRPGELESEPLPAGAAGGEARGREARDESPAGAHACFPPAPGGWSLRMQQRPLT
jgi:hypothetical protein